MKFEIDNVVDRDAKAGDIIVSGSTVALICFDKTDEKHYIVNLANGSLWSTKYRDLHKLIRHYFGGSDYELYKSSEAKLIIKKEGN